MNLQHVNKLLSYELLVHKGSPFELEDAVIGDVRCKVFPRGPQTLRDVFMKAASFAGRELLVKGDMRLTFGQALRQGAYLARNLLRKYNMKKGSRVALMAETGPEWAITFMACCFAGLVPVIIPVDAKGRAARKALELANCELIAADLSAAGKINAPDMKRPVVIPVMRRPDAISYVGASPDFSIFSLADAPEDETGAYVMDTCGTAPEDEALISFTSGTTGEPKGVTLNHRNITTGLMNMMLGGFRMSFCASGNGRKQPLNAQPCSLLLSPFSHVGGYSQLMLMCYLGGKIVLMPEWDARRAAALIESERVRSLCGLSPAMAGDLLRADQSVEKLRSLTQMNIYGVALRRKLIRELADKFPHINVGTGYGMTETCGAVSMVSGMELLGDPELSGPVLPSVNIKIVDHGGRETAQGNPGEIWVRGAMVMQGYCSVHDNSGAMLENGWLKTGDLGYVDLFGNLYVTGRLDALQHGKKQVSYGKLERLVCELDAVEEAAVFGTPDSGSVVVTVVPGSPMRIDENELTREVSSCVRAYADDIRVVIMSDVPRTPSGKVDRRTLRQLFGAFQK